MSQIYEWNKPLLYFKSSTHVWAVNRFWDILTFIWLMQNRWKLPSRGEKWKGLNSSSYCSSKSQKVWIWHNTPHMYLKVTSEMSKRFTNCVDLDLFNYLWSPVNSPLKLSRWSIEWSLFIDRQLGAGDPALSTWTLWAKHGDPGKTRFQNLDFSLIFYVLE